MNVIKTVISIFDVLLFFSFYVLQV